ncbi:MAG: hypothetical protein ASARMPRED_004027 [Alectoria sarmentosa]|nr:MAG: hypothetical protein ASARMPRED_004027 [Alectoria sarmentosa]
MGFFSKLRSKDKEGGGVATPRSKKKANAHTNGAVASTPPPKPLWEGDAWTRKEVEPEEIQDLLRGCTNELKSRALDMPFLLLPFRPASDPSAARTFIRNFFSMERDIELKGERLEQELMLTEPMVLSSVMKWCWSRLAGGVVTWEAYELFKVGEQDSDMARDAFATFMPLSVESDARTKIIFDFFDLMAAIAAHGKTNGMGGRKLSRLAGWWAFEQVDKGNGFDGGYKFWSSAADATSHLFFAYLRSLSPESVRGFNGISALPISLQTLVRDTQYPPTYPPFEATSKVVMVVNSVSPTPFALLRRAKHFEYRDDDQVLQQFSDFEDPVQALTDECRRVLKSISSANQSAVSNTKASTSLGDASWSRFEDIGFTGLGEHDDDDEPDSALGKKRKTQHLLRSAPQSRSNDLGRPTTPSWADFLSSGFVEESPSPAQAQLFLPSDKILPPIDLDGRAKSSQSHKLASNELEPGELASINAIDLDDAFWWVWITSLAGEETTERKSVFGRCALIETSISGGTWLVMEEMVKGAAPEPEVGAYIAEKKGRFTFGKMRTMSRTKTLGRKANAPKIDPFQRSNQSSPTIKTSIGPDQHARIQAAAAVLQQKQKQQEAGQDPIKLSPRRGREGDGISTKTNSVFTLQPVIMSEAGPAMKWANTYDKNSIRAAYLGNNFAGTGSATDFGAPGGNTLDTDASVTPQPTKAKEAPRPDYGFPKQNEQYRDLPISDSGIDTDRSLPPLPAATPSETMMQAPSSAPPPVPAPPAPLPVTDQIPSGPPPPAPLPIEPEAKPANAVAADAAEVPLPATTPVETIRKPLPTIQGEELEPTQTITGSQPNGLTPMSSPESRKDRRSVRKQQSGFKVFFGKKKGPILPATPHPADSTAVAAARAAYVGPQMKPNYFASASSTSLSRRFSGIGRKKAQPAPMPTSPPIADAEEPAPFKDNYESQASLSRVDSNDERAANREFHTFDQGPLDQPAFVPADDAHNSPRASFVPEDSTDYPSRLTTPDAGVHYPPPIRRGEYEPSVSSEERPPSSPMPMSMPISALEQPTQTDRWAHIRKNAAERAGRISEEKNSRMSQDKTEDGEESGEESKSSIQLIIERRC